MDAPLTDMTTADVQPAIRRAVAHLCGQHDWAILHEMPLPNRRRADVMALCPAGRLTCIEIKSGLPDFRSDLKWPEYRPWCDAFYFAVPAFFPRDVLPDDVGVMVVDLPAPPVRTSMIAAQRLNRMEDPTLATVLQTALRSD